MTGIFFGLMVACAIGAVLIFAVTINGPVYSHHRWSAGAFLFCLFGAPAFACMAVGAWLQAVLA